MARRIPTSLFDRIAYLQQLQSECEGEIHMYEREERYLREQIRKAQGQLAYYERLLRELKAGWMGGGRTLLNVVRRR